MEETNTTLRSNYTTIFFFNFNKVGFFKRELGEIEMNLQL